MGVFFLVMPLAQTPGPDLAQDAVMESKAFVSSENSCISKSRCARAGLYHGPLLGCFKMVYCALSLRIIGSIYINHFETPARHASKARRAGPLI